MKPIIGVVLRPEKSFEKHEIMYMYNEISAAIIKNGGLPIGIYPPTLEAYYGKDINTTNELSYKELDDLKLIVNLCDGIVCQGGDDYYDYDLKIIKYAHANNIPLIGICLGMQAMATTFGGELEKIDNLTHHQKDLDYVHEVKIKKASKLYNILNTCKIKVNSRHRWKVVKTDLNVVGLTDGVIEAIEDSSKDFFIGVQWHPESMIEYDALMDRLFNQFILSCISKIT